MSQHIYNGAFMDYTAASATRSANAVINLLSQQIPINSVLDIGCARGAWLAAWHRAGATQITGIDGHYVDKTSLLIPHDNFHVRDLSNDVDLGQQYDLVQSLEVAEHIDSSKANCFVANLVRHSNGLLLFSAAPPGQGGEHHVNEQPYDYWRQKFAAHDFLPFDYLRPLLRDHAEVSPWYRYNTLLYVHKDKIDTLPQEIRCTAVTPGVSIPDISPPWYRVRKMLIQLLPQKIQDQLATLAAKRNRSS